LQATIDTIETNKERDLTTSSALEMDEYPDDEYNNMHDSRVKSFNDFNTDVVEFPPDDFGESNYDSNDVQNIEISALREFLSMRAQKDKYELNEI